MSLVSKRYVSLFTWLFAACHLSHYEIAYASTDRVFGSGGAKIWTLYMYALCLYQSCEVCGLICGFFISSILLICYATSLDSSVSYTFYAIATSAFSGTPQFVNANLSGRLFRYISSAHSLLGAIDVAISIMGSVCRPFIAKVRAFSPAAFQTCYLCAQHVQIADHVSRPWAYLFSLFFYVLGYIIIASSKTVNAFAAGQVGTNATGTSISTTLSPLLLS